MSPNALKIIRRLFAAGEWVSPALAGRVAFALFSRTPDPARATEGERRAVDKAAPFMHKARPVRLETGAGAVVAHDFAARPGRGNKGTVLVLHGWRSRTEYMRALIEGFLDTGYRVVSLDLPGHGASAGRHLTMVSAVDATSVAGRRFGPFAITVGHSFGGAVAANAAAGSVPGIPPLATEKLALIAAPAATPLVFATFGRHLGLGPRSQAAMEDGVRRISGRPLADYDGVGQLRAAGVPTLVVHAPDDREVSTRHAEIYASAGDHVDLCWAPGLGHRRILADPDVVKAVVAFAGEHQPA